MGVGRRVLPRSRLFLATLALTLALAPSVRAAETTVLVLRNRALPAGEARLIEALRIYTRDLECRILVAGEAPAPQEKTVTVELVARQLRDEGADMAAWVQKRSDGRLVYELLAAHDLELRETELAPIGVVRAAEAVALKIRTLVSRRLGSVEPPDTAPGVGAEGALSAKAQGPGARAGAESPKTNVPPAAPTVAARPEVKGPPDPAADAVIVAPTAVIPGGSKASSPLTVPALALGAAYGVVVPRDPSWIRHGLFLSLEVRLGHRPWSVAVDTNFTFRAENTSAGRHVTLEDLPFGLAGLYRFPLSGWRVAVGPRASLHVFQVSASSLDGQAGAARRFEAGLGGLARVERVLNEGLRIYLGATLETLVPSRYFTFSGDRVLAIGPVMLGLVGGIVLAAP